MKYKEQRKELVRGISKSLNEMILLMDETNYCSHPMLWRTWCNMLSIFVRVTRTANEYDCIEMETRYALEQSFSYNIPNGNYIPNVFKSENIYKDIVEASTDTDTTLLSFYVNQMSVFKNGTPIKEVEPVETIDSYVSNMATIAKDVSGLAGVAILAICATLIGTVKEVTKDNKNKFTKYLDSTYSITYARFCGIVTEAYLYVKQFITDESLYDKFINVLCSCLKQCLRDENIPFLNLYAYSHMPEEEQTI